MYKLKKFLGYKYYWDDPRTIIEYGFHLWEFGKSYRMYRLINGKWKYTRAWAYTDTCKSLEELLQYLYWKKGIEEKSKKIFF